jgi:hypothetical protein
MNLDDLIADSIAQGRLPYGRPANRRERHVNSAVESMLAARNRRGPYTADQAREQARRITRQLDHLIDR